MPVLARMLLIWAAALFGCANATSAQPVQETIEGAKPVELVFAYFVSDGGYSYERVIAPFVERINTEGAGLVEVRLVVNGALGPDPTAQLDLVRSGVADIAFIVPGYTPAALPDHRVIELPGLFNTLREATLVHHKLASANMLRGLEEVKVLGGFATAPESIHTTQPVSTLADLAGRRIRVNNNMESAMLTEFGARPVVHDITEIATGLSKGEIDGAMLPLWPLVEFGAARIATHHFMLKTCAAPLAIVMNRKVFEGLSSEVQTIIEEASGDWLTGRFIDTITDFEDKVLADLAGNERRTVVEPSPADIDAADTIFEAVRNRWAAESTHNAALLAAAQAELGRIRSGDVK
ncbi:TRAP transporter substrate-binding protein DctP [Cucumibacter marinus]|uniref:TRAP transporter substrate-binding protein DctP n=1 Tax=Cucumibacter marinus TaxID=1121252 RepID=UPI000684D4E5|nr:TRAP transporter substrate-binding protein DctP [Cucumibacter marinus]